MVARHATVAAMLLILAAGLLSRTAAGDPDPPSPSPSVSTATSSGEPTPTPTPTPTPVPTPVPPPPAPPPGPMAPLVYSGSREVPVIALTIDDGFSGPAALSILAILQAEQVNATFFPIGRVVAADPSVWQQVAAAGFPIANHTWSHADLTSLSFEQIVADIDQFEVQVAAITGQPVLPVVRPMGGLWNETVLHAAAAAGQQAVVMWDTSFGDSGAGGVEQLIINATRGTNGSIVLFHASGFLSVEALPTVIAYYRERGFSFVTVGQLLGIPGPVPYGVTPSPTATAAPSPTPTPTATPRPTPTRRPTPSPTASPRPSSAEAIDEPMPSFADIYGAGAVLGLGTLLALAGLVWYRKRGPGAAPRG